jgi:hypothetical protein
MVSFLLHGVLSGVLSAVPAARFVLPALRLTFMTIRV